MAGIDSYTKAMLHMDGTDASTTFTDSEITPKTFTAVGNAQIDTAQSKFGGASGLFDGSGDTVTAVNSTDWNFGAANSGDFTIDCWLRFNSVAGVQGLIATWNGSDGWQIFINFNVPRISIYSDGNQYNIGWGPSTNTWYHFAIVRSGSTITQYIDGTSIGTYTDLGMDNDANGLIIGDTSTGFDGNCFNGWMDELRISKGIARWTGNFTPPTAAYSLAGSTGNFLAFM